MDRGRRRPARGADGTAGPTRLHRRSRGRLRRLGWNGEPRGAGRRRRARRSEGARRAEETMTDREWQIARVEELDRSEELYVVLTGRATFELGDEETDAPPGTLVFVRTGTVRGAVAAEPETTILAVGAKA